VNEVVEEEEHRCSNVGSGGGGAPKTKDAWPSVRRWSRLACGDSTPLGSMRAELALRSGMRDGVVVNEDVLRPLVFEVVQLRAAVREDRTRLDGARALSRDGCLRGRSWGRCLKGCLLRCR
jgi:hypothetical protein